MNNPFARKSTQAVTPTHVAIIMDGNRRWAKAKGLAAINGHQHVVDHVIQPIVERCIELGIPYLTLWAFSTENWERDKDEIEGMMQLFRRAFEKKIEELHEKGVRLNIIGDIDRFPQDIARNAKEWVQRSKDNDKITVSFALNYGGREEILRAIKQTLEHLTEQHQHDLKAEELEAIFEQHLATVGIPDPDLIIRPGGQFRLSGFLPWQSVYAELYFTDVLMPDFSVAAFDLALADFSSRQRRFGK